MGAAIAILIAALILAALAALLVGEYTDVSSLARTALIIMMMIGIALLVIRVIFSLAS